ncbi:hypothetical protein MMC26_002080 [Xylographa opegraphella]|nr:hypothetical protein [Xylographa opegraphella]
MTTNGLISMPRPRHFIHRADGTMTPLVALDELPDFIQIKNVPARLSVAETQGMTSLGLESRSLGSYQVDQDIYEAANPTEKGMSDRAAQPQSVAPTVTEEVSVSSASSSVDINVEEATDVQLSVDGWRRSVDKETSKAPTNKAPSIASTIRQSTRGPRRANSKASVATESRPYEPLTKGVLGRKEYCSHWIRKGECDFTQQGCIFKHVMPSLDKLEELGYRTYPRWFREAYDMTEDNRENFGRGPKPKPEPEPARHDQVPYRPQTPSMYNDLRGTYQAPMYGRPGPRSSYSVGGSRWPQDNYVPYQAGPIRGPPNGYQGMWNHQSQNVYGPRGPPFVNQQQGYRAQPQVAYPTAQYPHRPTYLYAPNQTPGKVVGAPPVVVQAPASASSPSLQQSSNTPQPMKVDSLFQRFDGLSPAARQSLTTPIGAAAQIVDSPVSQQAPNSPEHQILSRPPTANTFKDFSVMQPSQPIQYSESQTKPAAVQSVVSQQQTGSSKRGLYDGIPSVPGPRHTRRFVAPKQNNYQAPDANVETAKRQTGSHDVRKHTGVQDVKRNTTNQDVRKEQPAQNNAVRILTREKYPPQATSATSPVGTQTPSTSTLAQAAITTPTSTVDTNAQISKEQLDNAFPSASEKPAKPVVSRVRTSPRRHNVNGHGNGVSNSNGNGHSQANVKGRGRRMQSVDLVDLGT